MITTCAIVLFFLLGIITCGVEVIHDTSVTELPEIPDSFYYVTPEHAERFDSKLFFRLFDQKEFTMGAGDETDERLPYRLYKPIVQNPQERFALIVWLHGYGDDETSLQNLGQLKHLQLVFRDLTKPQQYRFFLLAPQNSASAKWFDIPSAEDGIAKRTVGEVVLALIDDLLVKYPIDRDRITLVGISSGGTAAWEFAERRPNLFAGVMPFSSAGADLARLKNLIKVPIWAFHASGDRVPPDGDRRAVSVLRSQGGCCYLTEIPGKEHNCWYQAFKDYRPLEWLLAQRKGGSCTPPPGLELLQQTERLVTTYWPQATVTIIVVAVAMLFFVQSRARR